jgi:hypothetical protein
MLKQYPKFLCTIPKQGQITLDIQITGSPALFEMGSPFDNEQVCFSTTIKAINLKLNTLVESVDPVLLTREDNSIQHFFLSYSSFLT